jgi:competence protein ComEC
MNARHLLALLSLLASTCCGLAAAEQSESTVTVLDVGYGLAVHFEQDGNNLLVDTGPAEAAGLLLDHFRERGVASLDCLVLTHLHPDHAGAALRVMGELSPREVIWNGDEPDDPSMAELMAEIKRRSGPDRPVAGQVAGGRDWRLKLLPGAGLGDANDRSLALVLEWPGGNLLIPSDAGTIGQREIASSFPPRGYLVDALIWPHHGDALDPALETRLGRVRACVVSTGPNPYGLPSPDLEATAGRLCEDLLRTDLAGDIVLRRPDRVTAP